MSRSPPRSNLHARRLITWRRVQEPLDRRLHDRERLGLFDEIVGQGSEDSSIDRVWGTAREAIGATASSSSSLLSPEERGMDRAPDARDFAQLATMPYIQERRELRP